jgi:hypothetical protein
METYYLTLQDQADMREIDRRMPLDRAKQSDYIDLHYPKYEHLFGANIVEEIAPLAAYHVAPPRGRVQPVVNNTTYVPVRSYQRRNPHTGELITVKSFSARRK